MKNFLSYLIVPLLALSIPGCTKDADNDNPMGLRNTTPKVNAGNDMILILPANQFTLKGDYSDDENNVKDFSWKKIDGPATYLIGNPASLTTQVGNLTAGIYQFELSVNDSMGLTGKDTVKAIVNSFPSSPRELELKNRTWISPLNSFIEIENYTSLIPKDIVFRVYIKRDNNSAWMEVSSAATAANNDPYVFMIEPKKDGNGRYLFDNLNIYYFGTDVGDSPDIKILY